MSSGNHPDEKSLLAFLEKQYNTRMYVFQTVQWLKEKYPLSHERLIGKLRKIYKEKNN